MSARKRTQTKAKSTKKTAKKPAKKTTRAKASKAASSKKTKPKKSARKPAPVKKPAAKKPAKKKPAAKSKPAAKKPAAKKPAKKTAKKAPAKRAVTKKKSPAKKAVAKKPVKKKAPAKKTAAVKKSAPRSKAKPAKKTASKKAPAKKASPKKSPAKKTTKKTSARKTAPKKTAASSRVTKSAKKTSRSSGKKAAAKPAAKTKTASKTAKSKKSSSSKTGSRPAKSSTKSPAKKKVRPIETEADASKRAGKGSASTKRRSATPTRPAKTTKKSSRSKSRSKAKARGKTADGRQPGQAMRVPPPVTEVLITGDLPDVRRAKIAAERQEGARGHMTPDAQGGGLKVPDWEEPVDASLMMSALAADASPKIEDNYDYSVLEDFEASEWCPRPTRMVNTACGGGEASVHFAKRNFRCVGIDSDRSQIGLARERAWLAGVDIDFMVGDLFETPNLLPAESFGLAIDRGGFAALENGRERQRYLANIRRLLFQGGIFLLSAGFFPLEDDGKRGRKAGKEDKLLLAREGGVVVNELKQGGFELLHRVLRATQDSGELAELFLYLRKP